MELSRKGFGAYDVRGIYPDEVNEELAYRVGKAFVQLLGAKRVAVGHDIRLSGPSISEALRAFALPAMAEAMSAEEKESKDRAFVASIKAMAKRTGGKVVIK